MKLPGFLALACVSGILVYALGAELAALPPRVKVPPGATLVSFADLAGTDLPGDPGQARQGDYLKGVPDRIRKLDNHRVVIEGFMIPTGTERARVRSFLLVRMQASCCFGLPPQISDIMEVRMAGESAEPLRDRTVDVVGTFHVQEHWAGPYLGSLYQMDADTVTAGGGPGPMPLTEIPQVQGLE
ncbi:MAG: DUF3299 domain-containing protein [Holophaga sp.]|jgi:hypothetical protein